ncbi:Uncharacterized protein BC141101_05790 [Bacillus toyonensis]|nr:hypothetical protein IGO_05497 [Bacillus toyonensis]EJV41979.1 hypothetical protein IEA_05478 [Bacillus toyonensis]EJV89971.1 hypothetical protein IGI_05485 [Bacillus toyonensis]EOP32186.1 hypothetical protein IG5_05632 [Bacillus toyonensis]EOP46990.1 hypothetical protein IKI_05544 [Bacillus toyonensis]
MNKKILWIALILSLLNVIPFNWYLGTTSTIVVFIDMIIKFSLYFIGIVLALYLIQYLRYKINVEKKDG